MNEKGMIPPEKSFLPVVQEVHFQDQALILETTEQIKKDFALFEIQLCFTEEQASPYDALSEVLVPHIQALIDSNMGGLYALLYQIDIPDHWWKMIRENAKESTLANTITDAVIQRELLKVITRNHFRQQRINPGGSGTAGL
jgi:hypothetical protein